MQTHPDVMIIPPDPPQMLVKVDQVRHVIGEIYYRPSEGRERVYIFSDADFMKEAANSLLKILEEPPDFATIFLLTDNPSALLPTIRSRSMQLRLAALVSGGGGRLSRRGAARVEGARAWPGGSTVRRGLGRARSFDLAQYLVARQDALALLAPAMGARDHSELFKVTESYRGGGDGKAKLDVDHSRAVFAAGRFVVREVGHAGDGSQHRHSVRAQAHERAGGFRLDRHGDAAAG